MEVINGTTQLERELHSTHPRLYLAQAGFDALRQKVQQPPWSGMRDRLLRVADAAVRNPCPAAGTEGKALDRGHGCALPALAMAWRLTGRAEYLATAGQYMRATVSYEDWGDSLVFGHVAAGVGLAYDWLYEALDPMDRDVIKIGLAARVAHAVRRQGTHEGWAAGVYTCNHLPVTFNGILTAAAALYGEVDGMAPALRLCLEKLRLMRDALGPDGVSQEGIGYGEYYSEFFIKALVLTRDLLNTDLFEPCEWLRNLPRFFLYSHLGRAYWTANDCVMHFGDGIRGHWYGPDVHCRLLASQYQDPVAQWLALETAEAGVARDSAVHLSLAWADPKIPATLPTDLPPWRHFADKDLVLMRSGWDGQETVCGFKCGPPFGHFAVSRYMHDIGGGHMCPDAGAFQIHAHGDWLIVDDGYAAKITRQQNTLLVNGRGQTGEGGDWMETTRYRMERRRPCILLAEGNAEWTYVVGDATPAYDPETGLLRFIRHFVFLKPDAWLVVDELEAKDPSRFESYLHSDYAFKPASGRSAVAGGKRANLRVDVMAPTDAEIAVFRQKLVPTGGHGLGELETLTVSNRKPEAKMLFLMALQAWPADGQAPSPAVATSTENGIRIEYPGRAVLMFRPTSTGKPAHVVQME